jgi:hypothetical protein
MFRLFITHIKAVMLSCILFLMFGDEKRRPPKYLLTMNV